MGFLDRYFKQKKVNYISPSMYHKMLEDHVPHILMDVRTQQEFDHEHIPNAVLFPVSIVEAKIKDFFPDKEMTYVLYCRSGIRSQSALLIMKQLGYDQVYDMGGIIDWPYETIKKSESI